MMVRSICLLILILISQIIYTNSNDVERILNWTNKIGEKLWKLGRILTENTELKSDYSNVDLAELNTKEIIKEMVTHVKDMLDIKKFALRRIVRDAEQCTKNLSETVNSDEKSNYTFRNARDEKSFSGEDMLQMKPNENFFNREVSTNFSTVHVPDDVYKKGNETYLGIKWSEILESTFQSNYAIDPTLSWQYFAGASGFMRIYPGVRWLTKDDEADLYDARMREWYIEAATDPKDIMILIDNSGSMMGQKREIARHTINTILETLSPNDFVNIIHFNNDSRPIIGCFNESLVQANVLTIRELKLGVENMTNATLLANFTKALEKAFTILENHRRDKLATMCNQAIMLITDGVPDSYIDIFKKYNWKNSTDSFPVRVFTYLIGRDGADFRETKWMACVNKGYYVQLNTVSEVKEQVLNYINVLARPLVLTKLRKIAWTSLYAHEVDTKLTDRYWAKQQNELQKSYTLEYIRSWENFLLPQNQLKRLKARRKLELNQNKNYGYNSYNFMVTISLPAYDERSTKNITENVLVNEAFWIQRVYEVRDAALLGVAATDVPITEFKKIMNPHMLGVNNYGFIVNNNGYIITHPDLRPMFGETLKPGYSTVDMLEVELLDSARSVDSRDFGIQVLLSQHDEEIYSLSNLSLLRDYIINQTDYSNQYSVKFHYDNMKRASTGVRHYSVKKIDDSPFTLVLAVMKPICKGQHPCPVVRILAPQEKPPPESITDIFSDKWTIHPDWFYCKYNYRNDYYKFGADDIITDKNSELIHFLKKIKKEGLNFAKNRYKKFMEESSKKEGKFLLLSHFCDEELIYNVIYDANITRKYFPRSKKVESASTDFNLSIANVFISTHSGFTRWQDFDTTNYQPFGNVYNRSIDEIWYKRAVDQHYTDDESFVFSVPFKDDEEQTGLVTASHAIFVKDRKRGKAESHEAPAAVVGYQFQHSGLESFIRKIVQDGYDRMEYDSTEEVNYVVLDNNGYIVASSKDGQAGQFFGNIQSSKMRQLKECNVYKQITIYDYQGVCFQDYHDLSNSAISVLVNPFKQLNKFLTWTVYSLLWGVVQINLELISSLVWFSLQCNAATPVIRDSPYMHMDEVPVLEERLDAELNETFEYFNASKYETGESPKYVQVRHLVKINRTRPKACDRRTALYSLEPFSKWDNKSSGCAELISSIKPIPHTNLIFVLLKDEFVEKKIDYEYFTTNPLKVKPKYYNYSSVCQKITGILSRRRPSSCCKHHKNESEIKLCGSGNRLNVDVGYLAVFLLSIVRTILR